MGVCKTKTNRAGDVEPKDVWKQAAKKRIVRRSPCGTYHEPLDRGVNYFVLMLEQLGAETHYSCEGHPNNFYVLFAAGYDVALAIANCGYFTVEVEGDYLWSLRLNRLVTEEERVRILTNAAKAWEKELGPLKPHANRSKLP